MLGQYQLADAELDQSRVNELDITVVRRPSGGGAIFTDGGALQISLIVPISAQESRECLAYNARKQFAGLLITALHQMGISACVKGRNDIVLQFGDNEKKIAGMAQFVRGQTVCTHASVLFDTNLETLASVLRVDSEKFRTKAVKSIRSRVGNIKDYVEHYGDDSVILQSCTTAEFVQCLQTAFVAAAGDRESENVQKYQLSAVDSEQIACLHLAKYGNPEWIAIKTPKFSVRTSRRFPAGRLDVCLDARKGIVERCSIHGDFLGLVPADSLQEAIVGLPYARDTFATALKKLNLRLYLGDISREEFLSCVFD